MFSKQITTINKRGEEKMKKIIALVTAVSFLMGNVSFAYDAVHLAPPSMLDDMAQNTSLAKPYAIARVGLEKTLLANREQIKNVTDIDTLRKFFQIVENNRKAQNGSLQEHTIFNPANITICHNQMERVRGSWFLVPVIVEKSSKRDTYWLLFSTKLDNAEGFPVIPPTKEELKSLRSGTLPTSFSTGENTHRAAIDRYVRHEQGIDKIISVAHEQGLVSALKVPGADGKDYESIINQLLGKLQLEIITPAGLTPFGKREAFIVKVTPAIKKMLEENPDYILDEESGRMVPITVWAHSSNNATHYFVSEARYNALANNASMYNGYMEFQKSLTSPLGKLVTDIGIPEDVIERIVHEIGAACGMPFTVKNSHKVPSQLDDRLKAYFDGKLKKDDIARYTLVDLDTNLGTRDYAAGGEVLADINQIAKEAEVRIRQAIHNASPQNCALKLIWWEVNREGMPIAQTLLEDLGFYKIRPNDNIQQKVTIYIQKLLKQLKKPGVLSYRFEKGAGSTYVKGEFSPVVTLRVEVPAYEWPKGKAGKSPADAPRDESASRELAKEKLLLSISCAVCSMEAQGDFIFVVKDIRIDRPASIYDKARKGTLYNLSTGQPVEELVDIAVDNFEFSPTYLAIRYGEKLTVYNPQTGKAFPGLEDIKVGYHDDKYGVTATHLIVDNEYKVTVYELATGKTVKAMEKLYGVHEVKLSSKHLAVCYENKLTVYDLASGKRVEGLIDLKADLGFMMTETRLAVCKTQHTGKIFNNNLTVYDLSTGKPIEALTDIETSLFTLAEDYLAVSGVFWRGLTVYNPVNGKVLTKIDEARTQDGLRITSTHAICAGGFRTLYDLKTGKPDNRFDKQLRSCTFYRLTKTHIAIVDMGDFYVYELATGRLVCTTRFLSGSFWGITDTHAGAHQYSTSPGAVFDLESGELISNVIVAPSMGEASIKVKVVSTDKGVGIVAVPKSENIGKSPADEMNIEEAKNMQKRLERARGEAKAAGLGTRDGESADDIYKRIEEAKKRQTDKSPADAEADYFGMLRDAEKDYIGKLAERYGGTAEIKNALAGARLGKVNAAKLSHTLKIEIELANAALIKAQETLMMAAPDVPGTRDYASAQALELQERKLGHELERLSSMLRRVEFQFERELREDDMFMVETAESHSAGRAFDTGKQSGYMTVGRLKDNIKYIEEELREVRKQLKVIREENRRSQPGRSPVTERRVSDSHPEEAVLPAESAGEIEPTDPGKSPADKKSAELDPSVRRCIEDVVARYCGPKRPCPYPADFDPSPKVQSRIIDIFVRMAVDYRDEDLEMPLNGDEKGYIGEVADHLMTYTGNPAIYELLREFAKSCLDKKDDPVTDITYTCFALINKLSEKGRKTIDMATFRIWLKAIAILATDIDHSLRLVGPDGAMSMINESNDAKEFESKVISAAAQRRAQGHSGRGEEHEFKPVGDAKTLGKSPEAALEIIYRNGVLQSKAFVLSDYPEYYKAVSDLRLAAGKGALDPLRDKESDNWKRTIRRDLGALEHEGILDSSLVLFTRSPHRNFELTEKGKFVMKFIQRLQELSEDELKELVIMYKNPDYLAGKDDLSVLHQRILGKVIDILNDLRGQPVDQNRFRLVDSKAFGGLVTLKAALSIKETDSLMKARVDEISLTKLEIARIKEVDGLAVPSLVRIKFNPAALVDYALFEQFAYDTLELFFGSAKIDLKQGIIRLKYTARFNQMIGIYTFEVSMDRNGAIQGIEFYNAPYTPLGQKLKEWLLAQKSWREEALSDSIVPAQPSAAVRNQQATFLFNELRNALGRHGVGIFDGKTYYEKIYENIQGEGLVGTGVLQISVSSGSLRFHSQETGIGRYSISEAVFGRDNTLIDTIFSDNSKNFSYPEPDLPLAFLVKPSGRSFYAIMDNGRLLEKWTGEGAFDAIVGPISAIAAKDIITKGQDEYKIVVNRYARITPTPTSGEGNVVSGEERMKVLLMWAAVSNMNLKEMLMNNKQYSVTRRDIERYEVRDEAYVGGKICREQNGLWKADWLSGGIRDKETLSGAVGEEKKGELPYYCQLDDMGKIVQIIERTSEKVADPFTGKGVDRLITNGTYVIGIATAANCAYIFDLQTGEIRNLYDDKGNPSKFPSYDEASRATLNKISPYYYRLINVSLDQRTVTIVFERKTHNPVTASKPSAEKFSDIIAVAYDLKTGVEAKRWQHDNIFPEDVSEYSFGAMHPRDPTTGKFIKEPDRSLAEEAAVRSAAPEGSVPATESFARTTSAPIAPEDVERLVNRAICQMIRMLSNRSGADFSVANLFPERGTSQDHMRQALEVLKQRKYVYPVFLKELGRTRYAPGEAFVRTFVRGSSTWSNILAAGFGGVNDAKLKAAIDEAVARAAEFTDKVAPTDPGKSPAAEADYFGMLRPAERAYIAKLAGRYGGTDEVKNALAGARLGLISAAELSDTLEIDLGLANAALMHAQETLAMAAPDKSTENEQHSPAAEFGRLLDKLRELLSLCDAIFNRSLPPGGPDYYKEQRMRAGNLDQTRQEVTRVARKLVELAPGVTDTELLASARNLFENESELVNEKDAMVAAATTAKPASPDMALSREESQGTGEKDSKSQADALKVIALMPSFENRVFAFTLTDFYQEYLIVREDLGLDRPAENWKETFSNVLKGLCNAGILKVNMATAPNTYSIKKDFIKAQLGAIEKIWLDYGEKKDSITRELQKTSVGDKILSQRGSEIGALRNKLREAVDNIISQIMVEATSPAQQMPLERVDDAVIPSFFATEPDPVNDVALRTVSARELLEKARAAVPEEYYIAGLSYTRLSQAFAECGVTNIARMDGKCLNIFSEGITFTEGFGIYLETLAAAGIRVAVVVSNESEKALIDMVNENLTRERRIAYGQSVADIMESDKAAKTYYYRLESESDVSVQNVVNIPLTIEKIMMILGRISGIVEEAKLEIFREAAKLFSQAA